MYVITNRLTVAAGFEEDFEQRFRERAGLVDENPGFVRNEIHRLRPGNFDREAGAWVVEPGEHSVYEVKTWWCSMDDFATWTRSESFRQAHRSRPDSDMFAAPGQLLIHEVVQSTDE